MQNFIKLIAAVRELSCQQK